MSEPEAEPAPAPPAWLAASRPQILAMAGSGVAPATIAAAIGVPEADLVAHVGREIEAERAKMVALIGQGLVKRALKGESREAIAAAQAWLRQAQAVSASPVAPAAAPSPDGIDAPPRGPLANLDQMAEALRISLPTMRKLLRRYPELPIVSRGTNGQAWQFDPAAVIAFVREQRAAEAAANAAKDELLAQISLPLEEAVPPEERGLSASDRLKNAQAMLKEDEVARQRGFLVLTSEMRQRLAPAWAEMSQSLQALPATLGRRHNLPDAVVRDMRAMIAAKQREIHAKLQDLLGAPPPPGDQEDAAAA